jgi:hypothetical protein
MTADLKERVPWLCGAESLPRPSAWRAMRRCRARDSGLSTASRHRHKGISFIVHCILVLSLPFVSVLLLLATLSLCASDDDGVPSRLWPHSQRRPREGSHSSPSSHHHTAAGDARITASYRISNIVSSLSLLLLFFPVHRFLPLRPSIRPVVTFCFHRSHPLQCGRERGAAARHLSAAVRGGAQTAGRRSLRLCSRRPADLQSDPHH